MFHALSELNASPINRYAGSWISWWITRLLALGRASRLPAVPSDWAAVPAVTLTSRVGASRRREASVNTGSVGEYRRVGGGARHLARRRPPAELSDRSGLSLFLLSPSPRSGEGESKKGR